MYRPFACMNVWASFTCLVPQEGIGSPKTGTKDGCELPGGVETLTPGLLEEQPVLLRAVPSLQPIIGPLLKIL